jgi:DNA repair exonuclease SbcCD ATPase subunit
MTEDRERKPDKSAEQIERLERELADEREHAQTLRKTVDELKFQAQILEQSYAKQLEDTRRQLETAERKIEDQAVRVVELDQAREDAIELLTEAKTELDRLTEERDHLKRQFASRDGHEVDPGQDHFDYDPAEGTINALMNDARWSRSSDGDAARKKREEPVETDAEKEAGNMLDPSLVLQK